jgi:5'-3' exonuclease
MQNVKYDIKRIMNDFVFLFFFIGNDFLPRCMAFNIRQDSIEKLISAFKRFLCYAQDYITGGE